MSGKQCRVCGDVKPAEGFHRCASSRDGLHSYCKECCRAYRRARATDTEVQARKTAKKKAWDAANREHVRAYGRRYRIANKARVQAALRDWKARRQHHMQAYKRCWYQSEPRKACAHQAVQRALARGALVRAASCSRCGVVGTTQAHHPSYERTRWLDVEWLCIGCHAAHHAEEKAA